MHFVAIENYTLDKPAGSEIRFIKMINHFAKNYEKTFILSRDLLDYAQDEKIEVGDSFVTYRYGNAKKRIWRILFVWCMRILQSIWYMPKRKKNLIIYVGASHFVDVVCAIFCKILNKKATYIQVIADVLVDGRIKKNNTLYSLLYFSVRKINFWLLQTFPDLIITVSSSIKNELQSQSFTNKIAVTGNGINKKQISVLYNKLPQNRPSYDGVFLGRLATSKGIWDLLEIWRIVAANIDYTLAIIGHPFDIDIGDLQRYIKKYRMENKIDILSFLPKEKVIQIFKSSKIFVYPSYYEGFGLAFAEAMQCRLPVVAYDLEVYHEHFLQGVIYQKCGDHAGFAQAVISLLTDTCLQQKISQCAYDSSQTIPTWEQVAAKELECITLFLNGEI